MMPPYTLPSEADVRLSMPGAAVHARSPPWSRGVLFGCAPAWQAHARRTSTTTLKEGGPSRRRRASPAAARAGRRRVRAGADAAGRRRPGDPQPDQADTRRPRLPHRALADVLAARTRGAAHGRRRRSTRSTASCSSACEAVPGVTAASVSTGMPVQGTSFGMPFYIAGKPVAGSVAAARRRVQHGERRTTSGRSASAWQRGRGVHRAGSRPARSRSRSSTRRSSRRYLNGVDPLTQRLVVEQLIPGVTRLGPARRMADRRRLSRRPQRRAAATTASRRSTCRSGRARGPARQWRFARPATRPRATRASPRSFGRLDPDLPMADVKTMDQLVSESLAGDRFNTVLFGGFAGVGAAARGVRDLRRDVVRRGAADARDRAAHGPRRRPPQRAVAGPEARGSGRRWSAS